MKSIYGLICPISKQVHYVGISGNPEQRFEQHLKDSADTAKVRWLKALAQWDLKPTLMIFSTVADDEGFAEEERWIAFALTMGWPLKNEALPRPGTLTYAHPKATFMSPGYIEYYNVPGHIALSRWHKRRWFGSPQEINLYKIWFRTVDDAVFYAYYPKNTIRNGWAIYGPSTYTIQWVSVGNGLKPAIDEIEWSTKLIPRKDDPNQGSPYSETNPLFADLHRGAQP